MEFLELELYEVGISGGVISGGGISRVRVLWRWSFRRWNYGVRSVGKKWKSGVVYTEAQWKQIPESQKVLQCRDRT